MTKIGLRYIRLPRLKLYGGEITLACPLVRYGKTGSKILIVSDSLTVEEADQGKLFSGAVGTIISGAFDTAIKYENQTPSAVLSVTTRRVKRPSVCSEAQSGHNDRLIIRQLRRVINKWQPDVIVFLGFQTFLRLWRRHVTTTERSYTNEQLILLRGRVLPIKISRHTCKMVLSFSARSVASQEYKYYKSKINLLGFVIKDFQAAIAGDNRYTLPEVDKSQRQIIRSIKEFDIFYRELLQCRTPCIDIEGDNLNRISGNILFVIMFCLDGIGAYLLPINHPQTPFLPSEIRYIISKLRWYFEHGISRFTTYHTGKFDITQFFTLLKLRYYNHRVYDVATGEYFLDENRKFMREEGVPGSYTLEIISAQYGALGYEDSPIKKTDRDRMRDFSLEETMAYADKDVCFDPDTYVKTKKGSIKISKLVEMKNPPKVLSFNHKLNKIEYKSIIASSKHKTTKRMVEIVYATHKLRVTEDHQIWSKQRGYIKAINLRKGEQIVVAPIKRPTNKYTSLNKRQGYLYKPNLIPWTNNRLEAVRRSGINRSTKSGRYHPAYRIYHQMLNRCYNTSNPRYKDYGGRGITVCKKWKNNIHEFLLWADRNGFDSNLQLERINNNKRYSPSNCKFATPREQSRNRRNNVYVKFEGKQQLLIDLIDKYAPTLNYHQVYLRIFRRKWGVREALNIDNPIDLFKIQYVKIINTPIYVCDITVKDNHNLFVSAGKKRFMLAHNCYLWHIARFQMQEAKRRGSDYSLFLQSVCELGSDTTLDFVEMEQNGIKVDYKYLTSLMAPNSQLMQELGKLQAKFRANPAIQAVNKRLLRQQGVPDRQISIFNRNGKSNGNGRHDDLWVFDINKQQHQQDLFFGELGLEALEYRKDGGGKINKPFLIEYKDTCAEVALLADWRQHEKLRNTYVVGLYKQLTRSPDNSVDNRLRPYFDFLMILTTRSCFTGDTPIYVLDDRCIVPIKDVKAGDWVWSYDNKLNPVPAQVSWSGPTKIAKTVTILYQSYGTDDKGSGKVKESVKIIRCSKNHRFRLKTGKYRRADKLKPGDRILALERHYNRDGYRRLFWTGMPQGRRILEHQYIIKHRRNYITHHDNDITDDNRPNNLMEMTQSEHMRVHYFDTYVSNKAKIRRKLRRQYRLGIRKSPTEGLLGKYNPHYKPLNKKWAMRVLIKNKGHPTIFRDKYGMDYTITLKKLKELGIDFRQIRQRYNGDDEYITDEMLEKAASFNSLNKAASYLKINYYKAQKLLAFDHNHVIIRVSKNKTREQLYDLEVPPFNNFIANGLCAHNSARSPNLQNIPSHGALAKIIKRLFIAELYHLFIKADYSAHEVRGWANIAKDHQIAASFAEGMKLRRQIRLALALDPTLDHQLAAYIAEIGWSAKIKDDKGNKTDKYSVEDKRKLVKRLHNSSPKMAKILALMIDLQIRGDVHRMNYQFFFGKPAETVNADERQSIKEVVFGVIYGKQAKALAESIYRKQIKPIRAKYMPQIRAALRDGDEEKTKRITQQMYNKLQPFYDKAQAIIDKLGDTFKRGWRWLEKTQERGRDTLRVISPFGAVRHLWAYLHNDFAVQHMMDRRGPNSVIQGSASNIVFTAARQMAHIVWQLRQNKLRLGYRNNNSVHDSLLTENKIAMIPLALYYMEHSMTSLVHKKCREVYGFDMIIGLEIELEIGGSEAALEKWDFTESSLLQIVGAGIDWQIKELNYKLDKKSLLRKVQHNYRIINQYRIKELQEQADSYAPSELMLLNPELAAQQNWKQ